MRKALQEKVIRKHFRHICKYCDKIPGHFDTEDIHELRVGYKKLRAFTRFLKPGHHFAHHGAAEDLRKLYHAAGRVRDMQLLAEEINQYLQQHGEALPWFLQALQHRLFIAKEQLIKAIEKFSKRKTLKELLEEWPHSFDQDDIKRFIHLKTGAIHLLQIAPRSDEELHSIRKQLKDILYVLKIFQHDLDQPFPVRAWKSEKELNDMATLLGEHNDKHIGLSYFQTGLMSDLPDNERLVIDQLKQDWTAGKEAQKTVILKKIGSLHLVSDFL